MERGYYKVGREGGCVMSDDGGDIIKWGGSDE